MGRAERGEKKHTIVGVFVDRNSSMDSVMYSDMLVRMNPVMTMVIAVCKMRGNVRTGS